MTNKKYIDDELDKNTIVRFNQTLQNYLKVSVGNDTYNLTKYDKTHLIDITENRSPNQGHILLPKWKIKNLNKVGGAKIGNFLKSTKTNEPTGKSGTTSLPPIGNSFMYLETSSNNHGNNVFVSCERIDIIQVSNITFYYNRFSILTDDFLKSMGRFRIQLLFEDNTWSTRYKIATNDRYSDTSTQWTLVNLNFTEENYGIRLIYDQKDTPHANICFSKITIEHSIFSMNNPNYFEDKFESITDYRKTVLLTLINDDKNLLKERGFSKNDIIRLSLEFKNLLMEQHEEYLDYVKNIEESAIEKFFIK